MLLAPTCISVYISLVVIITTFAYNITLHGHIITLIGIFFNSIYLYLLYTTLKKSVDLRHLV